MTWAPASSELQRTTNFWPIEDRDVSTLNHITRPTHDERIT
jgi:hypothetical protein